MATVDQLKRRVDRALSRPLTGPGQAAEVATTLFLLAEVHHSLPADLLAAFRSALCQAGLDDVLARQLEYGCLLAGAEGILLYEEMHRLVGLCDEVHALRSLGFTADRELAERFETALRARFETQRGIAHTAAHQLVQPWSRSLWWYAENLLRSASAV